MIRCVLFIAGMSTYEKINVPENEVQLGGLTGDKGVESVFKRADEKMYENKRDMKAERA